ncbi:hypothetical protein O9G_006183, partial [Rozella allomycis CSF55]
TNEKWALLYYSSHYLESTPYTSYFDGTTSKLITTSGYKHFKSVQEFLDHLTFYNQMKIIHFKTKTDSGKLLSKSFLEWCENRCPPIHFNPSPPYVKELNGLAERNIQTLKSMSSIMLTQAQLHGQYEPYAILYAAFIKNYQIRNLITTCPGL